MLPPQPTQTDCTARAARRFQLAAIDTLGEHKRLITYG